MSRWTCCGIAILRWSSGSRGQSCFRKMLSPPMPVVWCSVMLELRLQGSSLHTKREDQGCCRMGPKCHSGQWLHPLLLGWQNWPGGLFPTKVKMLDSFSGNWWISPHWSAGCWFLMKTQWCDGLSRTVTSVQCKNSELEQRSCPAKPGLFASEIPSSNCSFNDVFDRQRKHHCLLSLL